MANPVPGNFVLATLQLFDRHAKSVDLAGFAPIVWKSSDESIAAPAGPSDGISQLFECKGVGEATFTAQPKGLTQQYAGSVIVENPAGIVKGVVTIVPASAPVAAAPAAAAPKPVAPVPGK